MSNEPTSKDERDRYGMSAEDRQRLRALKDEEITAAALSDPDAQPLSAEQLARMRRPAYAKRIRQKMRMGQETFASTYGIPLETLRAWERHELQPTKVEIAYLRLIELKPEDAKLEPVA